MSRGSSGGMDQVKLKKRPHPDYEPVTNLREAISQLIPVLIVGVVVACCCGLVMSIFGLFVP